MNKIDKDVRIENGKLYGVKIQNSWTCQMPNGTKVAVSPTVDFNGIPLDRLLTLVWDAYKVKANTQLKKMDVEHVESSFVNKPVNWSTMLSAQAAKDEVMFNTMTTEEQLAEIERLKAIVAASQKNA